MFSLVEKLRPELIFNKNSLINSLKTVLACLIGMFLVRLFHLSQPQWVLISIIIVMAAQYRLGGAMLKGYARLFATALGSSIAALIIFLFSDNPAIVYTLLFLFIAVFIYLATNSKDYSYSYALGAVTMVIIVVSNNPQIHSALDRLIEIVLGVIIALFVSRFIFPIHAKKILEKNIANTLEQLKKIYCYSITEEKTFSVSSKESSFEDDIIQNLAAQPVLLREACTESSYVKENRFKYTVLLRLERRLLRTIYMLHLTLRVSLRDFKEILNMPEVKVLHKNIITMMDELSRKIKDKKVIISDINLNNFYNDIIVKIKPLFTQYSFENKNTIHAYLFCLQRMISLLDRMKKMVNELISLSL